VSNHRAPNHEQRLPPGSNVANQSRDRRRHLPPPDSDSDDAVEVVDDNYDGRKRMKMVRIRESLSRQHAYSPPSLRQYVRSLLTYLIHSPCAFVCLRAIHIPLAPTFCYMGTATDVYKYSPPYARCQQRRRTSLGNWVYFSCSKGLWDCLVLKPITTKQQSVFRLVSQSRRTCMSAIFVGICR